MTVLDYVAQIGGFLGLFIGFSLISAIEILYWLTFRLTRNKCASPVEEEKRGTDKGLSDGSLFNVAFYDPPTPSSSGSRGINNRVEATVVVEA